MYQQLMQLLVDKIPLWQMQCNMDPAAAEVSHAAMSEE